MVREWLRITRAIVWVAEATLRRLPMHGMRKWKWMFVSGCELQEPLFGSLISRYEEVEMVVREWLRITRAIVWVAEAALRRLPIARYKEVEMVVREWLRITRSIQNLNSCQDGANASVCSGKSKAIPIQAWTGP
jgi:hypothetical protein